MWLVVYAYLFGKEKSNILLLFHYLDKVEHFIRSLVGIVFFVIRHLVVGYEIFAPKLIYLKAALVHVEMNVALLKIWCAGLPDFRFGMQSLDCLPSTIANAFGVLFGRNEQDLKLVVMCFLVDLQDYAADLPSVNNDAICFAIGSIDATLNRLARDDLTVKIKMVVALAELLDSSILEGPLIIENKLLAVIRGQGNKGNF